MKTINADSVVGMAKSEFQAVRDCFLENYEKFDELGSAVCIIVDGNKVVDLYTGWKDVDRRSPWTKNTLVNIWSATKGVVAISFAMIVDAEMVSYDDLVAKFWPEFAVNGKEKITIAELLSHQAGLAAFDGPATIEQLLSGDTIADRLAAQAPMWPPGSASGYHMMTYGNIVSALFQRIEGRNIKQFIHDELFQKRGLDIHVGLPLNLRGDVADIVLSDSIDLSFRDNPTDLQSAVFTRPTVDPMVANEDIWKDANLPSANGYSNALTLAKLYAEVIDKAKPLISTETLNQATQMMVEGEDLILKIFARWGCGFALNAGGVYGPGARSFGHTGWGGSFAMADPDARLAMSYTPNNMGYKLRNDPRANVLIDAAYRCLS